MCNLYSMTTSIEAFRQFVKAFEIAEKQRTNWPPMPGIFPDYAAPIIRNAGDGARELAFARWGMPTPRSILDKSAVLRADKLAARGRPIDLDLLKRMEPDGGVTNIRNAASGHWTRWLGVEHRCVVPVTSFAEPEPQPDGSRPPAWFALDDSRPLMFFAGIHLRGWSSVRKAKTGMETVDLFAFLTCQPNAEVGGVHERAMPVILTAAPEVERWLSAPANDALRLQRPLPDGTLKIVARGERRGDPPELAAEFVTANSAEPNLF